MELVLNEAELKFAFVHCLRAPMSSSAAQAARIQRIQLDQNALAATNQRADVLRRVQYEAAQRLASAQATLDAVRDELASLDGQRLALQSGIYQARASYLRTLWTEWMPLDVLLCIFSELCNMPDPQWPEGRIGPVFAYNHERAATAFTLSAVCSRWRGVAIHSMPTLWSYISIPDRSNIPAPDGKLDAHIIRIHTLLHRSASAPLDVLVVWSAKPNPPASAQLAILFKAIEKHAGRFRRCLFNLHGSIKRDVVLPMFRAPTRTLEDLAIFIRQDRTSIDSVWEEDGRTSFLPFAPKLQRMEIYDAVLSFSQWHVGFPRLRSITLWPSSLSTTEQIHALIARNAAGLTSLHLAEGKPPIMADATAPIHMPNLTSITLGGFLPAHHMIRAPALQTLCLRSTVVQPAILPLLELFAPTVSTLRLFGDITVECLDILHVLEHVRNLVFDSAITTTYTVSDDFFVQLGQRPLVWSKLSSIVLQGKGRMIPEDGEGLMELVRARNAPKPTSPPESGPHPSRITTVDLHYDNVPEWLTATLESMLDLGK